MPLLGDAKHEDLVAFLSGVVGMLGDPAAILVISAHWECDQPTLTGRDDPDLIYDYYGFPQESYEIKYPAPGHTQLANEVLALMRDEGIQAILDYRRGFDHGLFVPLKLMYPEAKIPCVQLSLLRNLDPAKHINLGKSIAALRKKGVLIIGSGMSFHNIKYFFDFKAESRREDDEFNHWLIETCADQGMTPDEREKRLVEWESAPCSRFCHPREEHLLPLHVCYGAACFESPKAEVVFNQEVMGRKVVSFLWQ